MRNKYAIKDKSGIYFITFATVGWVDVFTRRSYKDILIKNLKYCQQNKGLIICSWCIMSNHVHLVASARGHNLSEILRDLKSFTAKEIMKTIALEPESRREWMQRIFFEAGKFNGNNTSFQFWQQDNHFTEIRNKNFAYQKFDYIHKNPVTSGIVDKAEEYIYSSARDFHFGKNCGLLAIRFWDETIDDIKA